MSDNESSEEARLRRLTDETMVALGAGDGWEEIPLPDAVRDLLAKGRDVTVNVAEVPVRAVTEPHRCVEHLDWIGGYPQYECLVCGKRLTVKDVNEARAKGPVE